MFKIKTKILISIAPIAVPLVLIYSYIQTPSESSIFCKDLEGKNISLFARQCLPTETKASFNFRYIEQPNFCEENYIGATEDYGTCYLEDFKLLKITVDDETYTKVTGVKSNKNQVKSLVNNVEPTPDRKTIIQLNNEDGCNNVFVKKDYSSIPGSMVGCPIASSMHSTSFFVTPNPNAPKTPYSIYRQIKQLDLVKENNLQVFILSSNNYLYQIKSEKPSKGIMLRNGYWERVNIILSVDLKVNRITAIINADFATGYFAPNSSTRFRSLNDSYPDAVINFSNKLQEQINQA